MLPLPSTLSYETEEVDVNYIQTTVQRLCPRFMAISKITGSPGRFHVLQGLMAHISMSDVLRACISDHMDVSMKKEERLEMFSMQIVNKLKAQPRNCEMTFKNTT